MKKIISFLHTRTQDLTNLAGSFWLKVKFSLRQELSRWSTIMESALSYTLKQSLLLDLNPMVERISKTVWQISFIFHPVPGLSRAKGLALGFPAYDPHTMDFTLAILRLHENDFLDKLKRKWWDMANECPEEQETSELQKKLHKFVYTRNPWEPLAL